MVLPSQTVSSHKVKVILSIRAPEVKVLFICFTESVISLPAEAQMQKAKSNKITSREKFTITPRDYFIWHM